MVELESEGEMDRSQVADFLRDFADELDEVGDATDRGAFDDTDDHPEHEHPEGTGEQHGYKRMTFIIGGESATVTVPDIVNLDVGVESRSRMFSSRISQEIDIELSWKLDQPDDEVEGEWIKIE